MTVPDTDGHEVRLGEDIKSPHASRDAASVNDGGAPRTGLRDRDFVDDLQFVVGSEVLELIEARRDPDGIGCPGSGVAALIASRKVQLPGWQTPASLGSGMPISSKRVTVKVAASQIDPDPIPESTDKASVALTKLRLRYVVSRKPRRFLHQRLVRRGIRRKSARGTATPPNSAKNPDRYNCCVDFYMFSPFLWLRPVRCQNNDPGREFRTQTRSGSS